MANKMSSEAIAAISLAVKEGHSVFCLEQLGVPQRVINLLYNNEIRSVASLVDKRPQNLLKIQNFGESNLRVVLDALSKYHTIEDI